MKKVTIAVLFIIAVCFSFLAGSHFKDQEHMQYREQRCHQMIAFAIDQTERIKDQYDPDEMEALISNIYAAYEYADDTELSSALHTLWNALLFDGEDLVGKENELIEVLQDADPKGIEEIAMGMRISN